MRLERRGRRTGDGRGQSMIELALLMPVLGLLLLTVVDFARAYNVPQRLAAAATAGLRKCAALLRHHCVRRRHIHRDGHAGRWHCVAIAVVEPMMRGAGDTSARRGQSTVEFALITTVFLGLLLA